MLAYRLNFLFHQSSGAKHTSRKTAFSSSSGVTHVLDDFVSLEFNHQKQPHTHSAFGNSVRDGPRVGKLVSPYTLKHPGLFLTL